MGILGLGAVKGEGAVVFLEEVGLLVMEPELAVGAAGEGWRTETVIPGYRGPGYIGAQAKEQPGVLKLHFRHGGWGPYAICIRALAGGEGPGMIGVRIPGETLLLERSGQLVSAGSEWVGMGVESGSGWSTLRAVPDNEPVHVRLMPGDYVLEIRAELNEVLIDRITLAHEHVTQDEAHAVQPSRIVDPLPWRLSTALKETDLRKRLIARNEWNPIPRAVDRQAWEALPAELRDDLISRGEAAKGYDWPSLTASAFLDYQRSGTRQPFDKLRVERRNHLADLVLAECAENEGRFLDDIANGIWATCEETWWGIPAHLHGDGTATGSLPHARQEGIDLFTPEVASLLAWTGYLLGPQLDELTPRLRERIAFEINERMLHAFRDRDDFGWLGLPSKWVNNHNTSINSHILACILLLEEDPDMRARLVHKVLRSLDSFLHSQVPDGGCEEGPGYWKRATGAFLGSLELLSLAVEGTFEIFNDPLVRGLAGFLPKVQIVGNEYYNFGDCDRRLPFPGMLLYRLGEAMDYPALRGLGIYIVQQEGRDAGTEGKGSRTHLGRVLVDWFKSPPVPKAPVQAPYPRDSWLADSEIFVARDEAGSPDGWFVAAMGAHNSQSHNHNDVGSFIVYHDGTPVFVDPGRENYSSIAFDYSKRYTMWYTQSSWHNLPTVLGFEQEAGRRFRALTAVHSTDAQQASVTMDLQEAYPPSAEITSWRRAITLKRGEGVNLADRYALVHPGKIEWSFITPRRVEAVKAGEFRLHLEDAEPVSLHYPEQLAVEVDSHPLTDGKMREAWPELNRIRLILKDSGKDGSFRFRVAKANFVERNR